MVKSMKRVTKSPPPIGVVDFLDFGPGSQKSRNWRFGPFGLPPSGLAFHEVSAEFSPPPSAPPH